MTPRTSIGRVKLLGLILKRGGEVYVVVDATEPGFTSVVRVNQVLDRMASKSGQEVFLVHRWNDRTSVDPVVRLCGDEFKTSHKGTYISIAERFGITQYTTLAMIDVVSM